MEKREEREGGGRAGDRVVHLTHEPGDYTMED